MAVLQDYGVSPESIHIMSQSQVDGMTTPSLASNGVSPTLGYLVKSSSDSDSDGGAVYLISVGKKYQIQSMQQFGDFGFNTSNIAYLPLSFIQTIPGSAMLSNYITTPTSTAFQVSGGQKRIIFDYQTYRNLNPSDFSTYVSYFDANLIPSGAPLTSGDVLVKYSDSDAVYLLTNNTYYSIPTADTYYCWGFEDSLHTPVYRVADNSYISPISPASALKCTVSDGQGNKYLMSKYFKYPIPSALGVANTQLADQNVTNLMSRIQTGNALSQYIRGAVAPSVYSVESGGKRRVPSFSDYLLLKVNKLSYVDDSSLSSIPDTGIKLGVGAVAKTNNSTTVYAITGSGRVAYGRSADYLAYKNDWQDIETFSPAELDQYYPDQNAQVKPYFYDADSDRVYLVDMSGCYTMDANMLAAYGQDKSAISSGQTYTTTLFPKLDLNTCKTASIYAKDANSPAVYLISNGQKRQFSSWTALVNYSHQSNPYIITVSTINLALLPTGSSI
jgi:hypothetical protein